MFLCKYVAGFQGDGVTCTWVGVCQSNNGGCHPQAACTESTGWFNLVKHGEFTVMYRNGTKAELSTWGAQLVEHLTCKKGVVGSIPALGK